MAWLGIGALGCAGGLRTEAEGGLPWREFETSHFVLRTDAESEEALEVARHLEDVFFVLGSVAFPYEPRFDGKTEVLFFSRESDLSLLRLDVLGVHVSGSWLQTTPSIVVAGETREWSGIVTHELVHQFVSFHLPQAPVWLHEGLAKYYETMSIEDDSLLIGEHPFAHERYTQFFVSSEQLIPLSSLRALDRTSFYDVERRQVNYVSAWTTVSALQMSERKVAFLAYLDALQSGTMSEDEAFLRHGRAWSDEVVARDQGKVLDKVAGDTVSFADFRRPGPPQCASKAMSPAAVHLLWARLLAHEPEEAVREARRALELEPGSAEALLVLAFVDPQKQHLGSRLWDAYEKSGRAARYGAVLLRGEGGDDAIERRRLDEVARRLTKEAKSSFELEALGSHLLRAGRANTAKKYAELAVRSDPSSARGYRLLARIAATEGDYARAFRYQTWSVNLGAHEVEPEELKLLDEYEKKLEAAGSASEQ